MASQNSTKYRQEPSWGQAFVATLSVVFMVLLWATCILNYFTAKKFRMTIQELERVDTRLQKVEMETRELNRRAELVAGAQRELR